MVVFVVPGYPIGCFEVFRQVIKEPCFIGDLAEGTMSPAKTRISAIGFNGCCQI